jgi:hypothetical protein
MNRRILGFGQESSRKRSAVFVRVAEQSFGKYKLDYYASSFALLFVDEQKSYKIKHG